MSVNQLTGTQIAWIVNTTNRKHKKPVIFTLDGNQRYQLAMADALSASFFHMIPNAAGLQIKYDPFFANDRNSMRMVMDVLQIDEYIHAGIAHDRYQHVNFITHVGKQLGFPTIYVEHEMPEPGFNLEGMDKELGDVAAIVFRSERQRDAWGYSADDPRVHVVYDFIGVCNRRREPSIDEWITIQDHIDAARFLLWDEIRDTDFRRENVEWRGWNGCLAYETTEVEEVSLFERHQGYVNFDNVDPLPQPLLQAAGYGMPIISVWTSELGKFFKHGESICFVETASELETAIRNYRWCLGNGEEAKVTQVGLNAREIIAEHFDRKRFRQLWTDLIKDVAYE